MPADLPLSDGVVRAPARVFLGLRTAWKRLRPLVGDRIRTVIVLAGASVGAGLAEAGVLALIAQVAAAMVVDDGRVGANLGPVALDLSVARALLAALGLGLVRLSLQLVVGWLPARISADVQARLRRDLFASFSRASWAAQADEADGHLQELMTSQVTQATQAVLHVATVLSAGSMFATLTASAFVLSVPVALVVLVSAVVLFAGLRPLNRWGRSAARDLSQANMDHAGGVSEAVRLAEEAQVFGTAAAHRRRMGEFIDASRRAFFRTQVAARLVLSIYQSLVILLIVGGLAGLYAVGSSDLALLGAAVLMLVRAATYGQHLQSSYHGLIEVLPYLDRLQAATDRYQASVPTDEGRPLPTIRSLAFAGATFAYRPGSPVLHDVTFSVEAGETIGIVGPSGAGKSTLVQLLLRLREPDGGAFLINGEPAHSFSRTDWQRRVAYVAQDPRILHASVAENIRYFRNLDDNAIECAARRAHIHDDIAAMPSRYETLVGQRADAVSGGQRQRICLARALAAQPDVLVLDEPTSALDMNSEAAVQASLAELHGQVTVFIVAHRLSTLNSCDRVLVLGVGAVQAFAPSEELRRTNTFYRESAALTAGPT